VNEDRPILSAYITCRYSADRFGLRGWRGLVGGLSRSSANCNWLSIKMDKSHWTTLQCGENKKNIGIGRVSDTWQL